MSMIGTIWTDMPPTEPGWHYIRFTSGNIQIRRATPRSYRFGDVDFWPMVPEPSELAELADLRRKAAAFDAELAAREATEREAAVPIDDEWLISMGFRDEDEYGSSYSNRWIVLRKTADGVWMLWVNGGMYSAYVGHIGKTRGNVLKLLAAFGNKV